MAVIRPSDLPAASSVADTAALIIDTGAVVQKATPSQLVDAAIPLASQAEAEAGANNAKRVTPLRVKQAIEALAVTPSVLAAPVGAELVGINEGGAGAANTTVAAAIGLGPLYTHLYGVRASNSAAVNVTNLNALIARATATGREIVVTEDGILLNANITVPVGYTEQVSIRGLGWGTGFTFTGAAVDKGFFFDGSAGIGAGVYAQTGGLAHLRFECINGAQRPATFKQVANAQVNHVCVETAPEAFYFYNCLVTQMTGCLILGCGNATTAAVRVTGDDLPAASTTFYWLYNYISGGLAGGSTAFAGGLSIDRVSAVSIMGGAIESNGLLIAIGGQSTSVRGVSDIEIGGGIDLENPGNGNPYIDVGSGWTGTASLGVTNLRLGMIAASPTGTTAMPCAARFKHCLGVEITSGAHLAPASPVCQWDFIGTTNAGVVVRANRRSYGNSYPWVRVNGTHDRIATPYADWNSLDPRTVNQRKVVTGGMLNAALSNAEGGVCAVLVLGNASATNVTNITFNGAALPTDAEITLYGDGFSTLKQAAGGTGQLLLGGSDILLGALDAARFSVDDAGRLRKV